MQWYYVYNNNSEGSILEDLKATYPISFSTKTYVVIGTTIRNGDIVNVYEKNISYCMYKIFERTTTGAAANAVMFVIIGS